MSNDIPNTINRIEVIGPDGREYVRYLRIGGETLSHCIQDDGRTLKFFIDFIGNKRDKNGNV
jgi:hypothetical protein